MISQTEEYKRTHQQIGTIRVGITGAVPPLELIDEKGEPYGFCAAFMDEIACRLGCCVEFEILDNETAFTGLIGQEIPRPGATA